jgi:cobalt/nickel transport system permease protein
MKIPQLHIPDGFINAPVSILFLAISAFFVFLALRGAKNQLDEKVAPLAGLAAVFIFAMQMINFPVAAGTSGHLIGGALAAILIGPWAGVLAVTVVLIVQALVFADGGLTAIGLNVFIMAVLATLGAWYIFRLLQKIFSKNRIGFLSATAIASYLSVPISAIGFTLQFALGGAAAITLDKVLIAMIGVHSVIGIGEAIITVLTISAVLSVRKDLVYGASDLKLSLVK